MTLEEYEKRKIELADQFNKAQYELDLEYAEANNPYKVGDIIEDHFHIIKIESWRMYRSVIGIRLEYKGVVLKKNLEPAKKQYYNKVFQSNVIRKIEGN